MAAGVHLMIWTGLAGLTIAGMFLSPPLHQLAWVKLGVVLVVALNGLNAHHLQGQLEETGPRTGRRLLIRAALTRSISQTGWWTACVIGFLNAA